MKVHVNGEAREITRATNIAEFVEELGLAAPTVLIEHNGLALRRTEWQERRLGEGDEIEILRIAAGG